MRKIDDKRVEHLRRAGLSQVIIAMRMGVTQGAIYHALRRIENRKRNASGGGAVSAKATIL